MFDINNKKLFIVILLKLIILILRYLVKYKITHVHTLKIGIHSLQG